MAPVERQAQSDFLVKICANSRQADNHFMNIVFSLFYWHLQSEDLLHRTRLARHEKISLLLENFI